jgi:hypothetical protein
LFAVFRDLFSAIDIASAYSIPKSMTIRNVQFINARTSVVSCVINNATVDVTINQIGAIATTAFLEEASTLIGKDFLFKKALILLKVSL